MCPPGASLLLLLARNICGLIYPRAVPILFPQRPNHRSGVGTICLRAGAASYFATDCRGAMRVGAIGAVGVHVLQAAPLPG